MPTALGFAQQEACNSITHGVTIMPRALARIHYFSYVSLNFSTDATHSFTTRGFCFQLFSVMTPHSIRLHPGLAETTIGVLVLHVISDIFSINVPSCCDYPCWQLDTDTYSNSVLSASAAWAQPSVCREGTPNAALCRDTCTASQLQAVLVNYRWTSAQDDDSAERWDARAKQKVLLKWQHSFESLCKRAKACSGFCVCCCIMLRGQAKALEGFLLQECTGMTQVGFSHAGALRRAAGSRHSAGM